MRNAGLLANIPAWQSSVQLGFAFIEFQIAVFLQTVAQTGAVDQCQHLCCRKPHDIGLRDSGFLQCFGAAGAPELIEPRHHFREIGRANGERPQRVHQPARHLAHDALRGQRQNFRKSQRRRIAGTRLLTDACAINNQHIAPGFGQKGGRYGTDNAAADDDNILLSHFMLIVGISFHSCAAPHRYSSRLHHQWSLGTRLLNRSASPSNNFLE